MRSTLRRLARMVIGYGTIQWAGPIVSFFFTPIITRILTPSDYGIADYVLTIASAVGTIALFALPQALAAHFNDLSAETYHRQIIGNALILAWIVGIPIGVGLVFASPLLAQSAFGNQRYTLLFQIAGATVAFGVCSTILIAAAQAAIRVRWGMLFGLTSIIATVVGNTVFIIVLRLGAMGMVLTFVTNGIAVSLVALMVMRDTIGRPSFALTKTLLRSGIVLMPTVISGWVLMVADRLFLVHYVSTDSLGYYAIANKMASLAYIVLSPLLTSWTSLALAIQYEADAKQRYADMSRYLIAITLCVALGLGLFATEILIVMTRPAYLPAAPYVGVLAYVHVFTGFGTVLYISAVVAKQLGFISWTVGAGAVINLVLNFLLIPTYGVWGATIATAIGYGVPQVLLYAILQRHYPVPYPTKRLLGALLVQSILLLIGELLPPIVFPIRIAAKALLFATLPIAFLPLGLITPFELRQARLFFQHQLQLGLARIQH